MLSGKNKEVTGFVRADGTKLRNGVGEELLLRGVGFGSWLLPEGYMWRFPREGDRPRRIEAMIERLIGKERAEQFWDAYYARYIAEVDIVRIAEEGMNSVRLPINSRFLLDESADPGAPVYREDRLALIDQVIDWCRTYGLYVILDLHGAPGGQTGTNIDDSASDRPELFTVEANHRLTVELWRMLADRYKDEWIVAGYDLLNEPLPDWFSSLYGKVMPLYRDIVQAIREVDQRHMIILEGVHWSTDWSIFEDAFGDDPIDDNVLLQFHKYWNNPDTESIAGYLELRERWQVPIFMGEGGENNKAWYTGAFQLFEDHEISWNFWTWKKLSTTNSPCSIRTPEGWGLLVDYLQGGQQPSADMAERILWDYLDNMRLADCEYRPEVVRSLLRRAPVRIPAVFYGYRGEGISYSLATGRTQEYAGDGLGSGRGVGFRAGDGTTIRFVDSERTTATFAHGGGEAWTPDQWLCLELAAGDWFVYDVGGAADLSELSLRLMLQAPGGSGRLEAELDEQPLGGVHVPSAGWQEYGNLPLGPVAPGPHRLTLRCTEGRLRFMWLAVDEA